MKVQPSRNGSSVSKKAATVSRRSPGAAPEFRQMRESEHDDPEPDADHAEPVAPGKEEKTAPEAAGTRSAEAIR